MKNLPTKKLKESPDPQSRLGKFHISRDLIVRNWTTLSPLFRRVVVVHAEAKFDRDIIEYTAISKLFDERELDEARSFEPPTYDARMRRGKNGHTYFDSFVRVQ